MSLAEIAGEGFRAVAQIADATMSLARDATYVVLGIGVVVGQTLLDAGRRIAGRGGDRPEAPRAAA